MKHDWVRFLLCAVLGASMVCGCGGSGVATRPRSVAGGKQATVAVVSLTVNDYSRSLSYTGGVDSSRFIDANLNRILDLTEQQLGGHFQVKPAASFVADAAYRGLSIGTVKEGLFAPKFQGIRMPTFTDNRDQIIKAWLSPETARALCSTLQVDYVFVAYSEWAVATGRMVPTQKALAKNCAALYGRDGKQLFFARKDVQGAKTLGAMNRIAVNEETIGEWVAAYDLGLRDILLAKIR